MQPPNRELPPVLDLARSVTSEAGILGFDSDHLRLAEALLEANGELDKWRRNVQFVKTWRRAEAAESKLVEAEKALEEATSGNGFPRWATHMLLDWCADRLVNVYGESENIDFVQAIRRTARKVESAREVLARIRGTDGTLAGD